MTTAPVTERAEIRPPPAQCALRWPRAATVLTRAVGAYQAR